MERVSVKAPANVKISGEHAVVYGGSSLSAAITLYATAEADYASNGALEVVLSDLGVRASFSADGLDGLYKAYSSRDQRSNGSIQSYIAGSGVDKDFLPYATIAARLHGQYGVEVAGRKITISSEVPVKKGYASSAVCSTAFAVAVLRSAGVELDDRSAVDAIRDGERVAHGMEDAGRIDVGTAYYGGYATFSAAEGIRKADIARKVRMVVFDTGPKPPTSEMLRKVKELYDADIEGTSAIFRDIDDCVGRCVDALRGGDLGELGRQMTRNHGLLRRLGVSSERLDEAVSVAAKSGALGAKLCGGGGGGIGVALVADNKSSRSVISAMEAEGFGAMEVVVADCGAAQCR